MSAEVLYVHEETIHNKSAARIVLPFVFKMRQPRSVLDVGCGLGTWLSVCEELGVSDYLGVDGSYVDLKLLTIPQTNFKIFDLRKSFSLGRKFDLVICLEVAEHLPEQVADEFVNNLVTHGETILFSAAIPGQGGQNHINEQWPSYWEAKFNKHGFYFHDIVRSNFWDNKKVEIWYRQNMFMVTKQKPGSKVLDVVHPDLFKMQMSIKDEYVSSLVAGRHGVMVSLRIFLNAVKTKLKSIFGSR